MAQCIKCKEEIDEKVEACPYCGHSTLPGEQIATKSQKRFQLIAKILIIMFTFIGAVGIWNYWIHRHDSTVTSRVAYIVQDYISNFDTAQKTYTNVPINAIGTVEQKIKTQRGYDLIIYDRQKGDKHFVIVVHVDKQLANKVEEGNFVSAEGLSHGATVDGNNIIINIDGERLNEK